MKKPNANLIGLQPFMELNDYRSLSSFRNKLDKSFDKVKNNLNENTIVAFPEYLGTWLVASGLKQSAYEATKIEETMVGIFQQSPTKFVFSCLKARSLQKAAFLTQSKMMAEIYQETFSFLAKKYKVTVVAGSIILPDPKVVQGRLKTSPGRLYNVSLIYHPNGLADENIVKKIYVTSAEKFLSSGSLDDLKLIDTASGKLAVVICADSWFPQIYKKLELLKPDFLVVPSYSDTTWAEPWKGYDGQATPEDIDLNDVGRISNQEAWQKYAFMGRARKMDIKYGLNIFLRGKFWDLKCDGKATLIENGIGRIDENSKEEVTVSF